MPPSDPLDDIVTSIIDQDAEVADARLLARRCAAFYTELIKGGVEESSALELTEAWMNQYDDGTDEDG